jgi:hypothetical protein
MALVDALVFLGTMRSDLFLQLIRFSAPDLPEGQLYPVASVCVLLGVIFFFSFSHSCEWLGGPAAKVLVGEEG